VNNRKTIKGYLYTFEVLIAVSIFILAFVFMYKTAPLKSNMEISIIKQEGFDALDYMNNNDDLPRLVNENNEQAIEDMLQSILPPEIFFETEICTSDCNKANVPANMTVISVDYYVSGYKNQYAGKKVKLWLWV